MRVFFIIVCSCIYAWSTVELSQNTWTRDSYGAFTTGKKVGFSYYGHMCFIYLNNTFSSYFGCKYMFCARTTLRTFKCVWKKLLNTFIEVHTAFMGYFFQWSTALLHKDSFSPVKINCISFIDAPARCVLYHLRDSEIHLNYVDEVHSFL